MGASGGATFARGHKPLLRIRPILTRLKWGGQRDWLGFAQASYAGAAAPPISALRAPSNFVLVPLRMGRPTGLVGPGGQVPCTCPAGQPFSAPVVLRRTQGCPMSAFGLGTRPVFSKMGRPTGLVGLRPSALRRCCGTARLRATRSVELRSRPVENGAANGIGWPRGPSALHSRCCATLLRSLCSLRRTQGCPMSAFGLGTRPVSSKMGRPTGLVGLRPSALRRCCGTARLRAARSVELRSRPVENGAANGIGWPLEPSALHLSCWTALLRTCGASSNPRVLVPFTKNGAANGTRTNFWPLKPNRE